MMTAKKKMATPKKRTATGQGRVVGYKKGGTTAKKTTAKKGVATAKKASANKRVPTAKKTGNKKTGNKRVMIAKPQRRLRRAPVAAVAVESAHPHLPWIAEAHPVGNPRGVKEILADIERDFAPIMARLAQ
jgi:hypothetical protein